MQRPTIRIVTPVICTVGILALLRFLAKTGDVEKMIWSDQVFALLFYAGPSAILACLGYQETKSGAFPVALLVSSSVLNAPWIITLFSRIDRVTDAQAGMPIAFYGLFQWFIVVLLTIVSALLQKKRKVD